MGKYHKVMGKNAYDTFKDTIYIKCVEQQLKCDDFKKECEKPNSKYKGQYAFMVDTFDTFINSSNCFNSDKNCGIDKKIDEALSIMRRYIYVDYENTNRKKYSNDFVKAVVDEYISHLCYKINEWYKSLSLRESNDIKKVLKEIDKEMAKLEKINFDSKVSDNITYQKNKNSNYKVYINKLGFFSDDITSSTELYVNEYNENNDKDNQIELDVFMIIVPYLFDYVVWGMNAMSIKLYGNMPPINVENGKRTYPIDYYKQIMEIDLNNQLQKRNEYLFSREFWRTFSYFNDISFNEFINDMFLYMFICNVEELQKTKFSEDEDVSANIIQVIKSKKYSTINKIYEDIVEAYKHIINKEYSNAYEIFDKIIQRNKKYFKRMW